MTTRICANPDCAKPLVCRLCNGNCLRGCLAHNGFPDGVCDFCMLCHACKKYKRWTSPHHLCAHPDCTETVCRECGQFCAKHRSGKCANPDCKESLRCSECVERLLPCNYCVASAKSGLCTLCILCRVCGKYKKGNQHCKNCARQYCDEWVCDDCGEYCPKHRAANEPKKEAKEEKKPEQNASPPSSSSSSSSSSSLSVTGKKATCDRCGDTFQSGTPRFDCEGCDCTKVLCMECNIASRYYCKACAKATCADVADKKSNTKDTLWVCRNCKKSGAPAGFTVCTRAGCTHFICKQCESCGEHKDNRRCRRCHMWAADHKPDPIQLTMDMLCGRCYEKKEAEEQKCARCDRKLGGKKKQFTCPRAGCSQTVCAKCWEHTDVCPAHDPVCGRCDAKIEGKEERKTCEDCDALLCGLCTDLGMRRCGKHLKSRVCAFCEDVIIPTEDTPTCRVCDEESAICPNCHRCSLCKASTKRARLLMQCHRCSEEIGGEETAEECKACGGALCPGCFKRNKLCIGCRACGACGKYYLFESSGHCNACSKDFCSACKPKHEHAATRAQKPLFTRRA